MIGCYLHDATLLCETSHLVVGEVARVVAEGATAGVGAHYRLGAQFQRIVERALGGMTEVYHDAELVHACNDLTAEGAHAAPCLCAACRVADVVVAVVAQGGVDDASLGKMVNVVERVVKGLSVLYAQHYGA